jgi:hypothetical protein
VEGEGLRLDDRLRVKDKLVEDEWLDDKLVDCEQVVVELHQQVWLPS